MKKKGKTAIRKKSASKLPSVLTHQRFGILRLARSEYETQLEWCGHTIGFSLNVRDSASEESVRQQLDLASILLIDQASWQLKIEGFIKQALKQGEGKQLFGSLSSHKVSHLAKCFEPRIVSCNLNDNHVLELRFYLAFTAPDFPEDHFYWTVSCRVEPLCESIDLDAD